MHVSQFTQMADDAEQRELVRRVGVAQVITTDADGWPQATLLPVVWEDDRLMMHAAADNSQFEGLVGRSVPALAVVTGPNAYVSPTWYPTRAKRGLAVPTWNYQVVQVRGMLSGYDDRDRLREAVAAVSAAHEEGRAYPWTLQDAPSSLIEGLLLGVIGLELAVQEVRAKAKPPGTPATPPHR